MNDILIELIISSTLIPELQKNLLSKPKGYKLNDAIALAHNYEASNSHVMSIQNLHGESQQVSDISQRKHSSKRQPRSTKYKNCGRDHRYGKEHCLARNDTSKKCGKLGHWGIVCLSAKYKKCSKSRDKCHHQKKENSKQNMNSLAQNQQDQ